MKGIIKTVSKTPFNPVFGDRGARVVCGKCAYPLYGEIIEELCYYNSFEFQDKFTAQVISSESLQFSNENIKVKINSTVRGDDVYVIQPSYPNLHDRIMELFITIDALKHASAGRITAVIPYMPYVRSDKKDEARISISCRLMADLIESSGADRVITMSLHSPQAQGFFRIPIDHLLPDKILINFLQFKIHKDDSIIVAPDTGAAKMAKRLATALNMPLAIINKVRVDDSENPVMGTVIGDVKNKKCLIYDDEICSGGSIFKATDLLIEKGAKSVEACAIHGVLTGDVFNKLNNSSLKKLYITNTIVRGEALSHKKIEIISVAKMFADAIRATHYNTSMTEVFDRFY